MQQLKLCLILFLSFAIAVKADETNFYFGLGSSYVQHSNLILETRRDFSTDVQMGFSRQVSNNWRLGSGVDLVVHRLAETINSQNILTWRTMSLDYQLFDHWAGSFYVGMSRFYRERPGYGYGAGAGIKYQLYDKWTLAGELNWTEVDTSTGIPREINSHQRDTLNWVNLSLLYYF